MSGGARRAGAGTAGLCLGLALSGVAGHALADDFRKGPFLQNVTTTAITIVFETEEPTTAIVRWGPTRDHDRSQRSDEATRHEVRIEGLLPSAIYHYQVQAGDALSRDRRFATAATAEEPFRLVVYGDNRSGDADHARVVDAIRAEDADVLVNTGDMVDRGNDADDWQTFFDVERKLLAETPLFPVIGNHEIFGASGRAQFRRWFSNPEGSLFPEEDYAFTFGNSRFVVLTAYEGFPKRQLDWLRDTLADAVADPAIRHRFVFLHHGPYSSGYHGGNAEALRAGLPRILRDGEVDVVFSGHDHMYERGRVSGLSYVVTGGGGAPLYDVNTRRRGQEAFEASHHFVRVDVVGDSVEVTAVRPDGSVIDTCATEGRAEGWRCPVPPEPDAVTHPAASGAGGAPAGARSAVPPPGAGCGGAGVAVVVPLLALLVLGLAGLYARVRASRRGRAEG